MLSNNFDIIRNQSVTFTDTETDCEAPEINYQNIVNADDVTQVQFKLYEGDDQNLIYNPEFTMGTSGYVLSNMFLVGGGGGVVNTLGGSVSSITLSPNNLYMPFGEKAYMKVVFNIERNECGCTLFAGMEYKEIQAGLTGEFELYGMFGDGSSGVLAQDIKIETCSEDGNFMVTSIYAYNIKYDYIFLIRNLNDNTVHSTYALRSFLDFDSPYGSEPFRLIGNNLTWTIDWSLLEIADGCYQLEVCDWSINTNLQNGIPNQDFNAQDLDYLSFDSANVAVGFSGDSSISLSHIAGVAGNFQFTTLGAPISGLNYNYLVTFEDVYLGTGGISYYIGFSGDNDTGFVTTSGNKSGDLTSDGGSFTFSLILTGNASCKITIARLYFSDENSYVGNYISNTFKVTSNECGTLVLHGCSDNDYAFNLNFGSSSYTMKARLQGKLTNANYEFKRTGFIYGENSNSRTVYFNRKKVKQLKLNILPEYLLDFVSAVIGLDHIYVDNVKYQLHGEEFFSLNFSENVDNYGFITLQLFEIDSTIESKACVSLGVGCSNDVNCILDPEDDTCLIDPQTNDPVISLE